MAGQWETIREAIAAKLAASTGLAAAGLRAADTNNGDEITPPVIRVLAVEDYELLEQPNALLEQYRLTIPAELIVDWPDGEKRSAPIVSDIARAVQVEWQTGVKLGLPTYVVRSWLQGYTRGLVEYADTDRDGGRFVFVVDVNETLSTSRTA